MTKETGPYQAKTRVHYIEKEFGQSEIDDILNKILKDTTSVEAAGDERYEEVDLFLNIFDQLRGASKQCMTIVEESEHIDSQYTDAYYHHFSGLHYFPDKYCKRLTFFDERIKMLDFGRKEEHARLKASFLGTIVIRPLKRGFIGRTFLDPYKFMNENQKNQIYFRTARFRKHILGIEFEIESFPFCSQDSCFMTCAEVTIMNIMEYYAARYHTYREVLPSDIKELARRYQYERVTPSVGLTYFVVSKILSEFGFSPRVYSLEAMKKKPLVGDDRENEIKRVMHYYVESGIPVAVDVESTKGEYKAGHSLICIGHSGKMNTERALQRAVVYSEKPHALVNSADFYTEYCIIDDHQMPFSIKKYTEISNFSDMKISNLVVPLYRKMYLEAISAYDIFAAIFNDDTIGVGAWKIPEGYLAEDEEVVARIYQASSRSFKEYKVGSYGDDHMGRRTIFSDLRLPQFIWVCEYYAFSRYTDEDENKEKRAFAMIILDATASGNGDYVESIVVIETVDRLLIRGNRNRYTSLYEYEIKGDAPMEIPIYTGNLQSKKE